MLSSAPMPFSPLVTSCDTSTASVIGTAKASSTTVMSCRGVLIGEECSSVMADSVVEVVPNVRHCTLGARLCIAIGWPGIIPVHVVAKISWWTLWLREA